MSYSSGHILLGRRIFHTDIHVSKNSAKANLTVLFLRLQAAGSFLDDGGVEPITQCFPWLLSAIYQMHMPKASGKTTTLSLNFYFMTTAKKSFKFIKEMLYIHPYNLIETTDAW